MQTLRPSQVPEYLWTSSFYLGLNAADDDEFSIPLNHMKLNTIVNTLSDMTELLNTIRFWGFEDFPRALIDFAELQPYTNIQSILEPYRADLKFITTLCCIASDSPDQSVRLEKAMETGNIDAVKYFHKGAQFTTRAIALSAGSNALDCLQYALSDTTTGRYENRNGNEVFVEAVRNGCMDSIVFLQRKGFPVRRANYADYYSPFSLLTELAASTGQYDVLKYLHSQGCLIDLAAIAAADAGHFDCLEYAIENGATLRGENVTTKPKSANWDSFRLCVLNRVRPSIRLIAAAAECGSVACLQHLHQVCASSAEVFGHRLNWLFYAFSISCESHLQPTDIVQVAVEAQQWECLRFLITHDSPMNKHLTTSLAHAGQLELYHLATAHDCKVSVQAACQFARDGNINLLQHSFQHGCERSEEILRAAARHGQLQCLIYAHSQGCLWSAYVSLEAARGGHLECLQYLQEHGRPSNVQVRSLKRKHDSVG